MFLKIQELADLPGGEEEERRTDDNGIGRNVPFFEKRYPNDERLVAFAPAGPGCAIFLDPALLDDSKHYICSIEALDGPYKRQLIISKHYAGLQLPLQQHHPNVSVTDLTSRNSIVVCLSW